MKAIVVRQPGGPEELLVAEVPDLVPAEGQVLIQVAATALNRADLLQRRGKYPPPRGESDILGLECSGTVSAIGAGVSRCRVGDRVMALLAGGGYAEQVLIHERMAIPVPDGLDLVTAAAVPEAFLTAREALFTLGALTSGCTVLIHAAAGGVGSAAVQLARLAGARVLATAGGPQKCERVTALGAHRAIDYKQEDFAEVVLAETDGKGADAVIDFIGAKYWPQHATCMATGGRCVIIGVLGGAKVEVDFSKLLFKRQQILGLVMRSRPLADKIAISERFISESLPSLARGELKAVVDSTFPLSDAALAHERMEANANTGKILLTLS
jgi:putative PIG3 family NAD(P)H quinone oxidoreductase